MIIGSALILAWRNRVLTIPRHGIDQTAPEMSDAAAD
jgi:hypothetical protein